MQLRDSITPSELDSLEQNYIETMEMDDEINLTLFIGINSRQKIITTTNRRGEDTEKSKLQRVFEYEDEEVYIYLVTEEE